MPRSQREWALRKLQMAEGNVEKAGEHLEAVRVVYAEDYPEITKRIEKLQEGVLTLSQVLTRFYEDF